MVEAQDINLELNGIHSSVKCFIKSIPMDCVSGAMIPIGMVSKMSVKSYMFYLHSTAVKPNHLPKKHDVSCEAFSKSRHAHRPRAHN